jgi:ABC-2 type transport system permease protein
MSRWRAIWLVARRELLERGRSRAFLLSLGLTVAFILAGIILPTLLGGPDKPTRLGIVGTPPASFASLLAQTADRAGVKISTELVSD